MRAPPQSLAAGYLGRLAARMHDDEPPLQRRRPALFEPTSIPPMEPAEPFGESVEVMREDAAPLAAAVRRREPEPRAFEATPLVSPSQAPSVPTMRHFPASVSPRAPEITEPAIPARQPPRMAEAPSLRGDEPQPMQALAVDRTISERAPTATSIAAAMPKASAAPAAPPDQSVRPVQTERAPSHPAPVEARPLRAEQRAVKPPDAESIFARREESAKPAPSPIVNRAREPEGARPSVRTSIATSPAHTAPIARARAPMPSPVHVTIGRIEVRAVPAPSPQKRDTPVAGPRLTLDDYLRGRGGNAR